MRILGVNKHEINNILDEMFDGDAKAVTCSNFDKHVSIVLFGEHSSKDDYINSIVHEAEHVKQAMLDAYNVDDSGEAPAYTIGYIISKMYKVFNKILCCNDRIAY